MRQGPRNTTNSRTLFSAIVLSVMAYLPLQALAQTWGFPYGSQKVRGVNLGGWLVLEPWITPSLFDATGDDRIIDEWTFGQYQPHDVALAALKQHWDTWITESDFAAIAAAGLNHVRLPVGYWAFDVSAGEPYVQGQLPYLQQAAIWAARYNLKVIVDLHGAPGSQNGFDNSGEKMSSPTWHMQQANLDRTKSAIQQIVALFGAQSGSVPIVAPLNEPAGFVSQSLLDTARQYWLDSYGDIAFPSGSSQRSNTVVLIHDAFQGTAYWNGFMSSPSYTGVMLDTHVYQVFDDGEVAWSEDEHIAQICDLGGSMTAANLWTITGEFSPARTDCARYLNGRGVGARFDGTYPGSAFVGSCAGFTGKASGFSDEYKTFLRRFWEAQIITWEKGQGWMQWTWKTEEADEWSYQAGLANGWIPQNPADLQYPGICG